MTTRIEWFNPEESPKIRSKITKRFSVDVLIHTIHGEHTLGWYSFEENKWCMLCGQRIRLFKWRYFRKDIDEWDWEKEKINN